MTLIEVAITSYCFNRLRAVYLFLQLATRMRERRTKKKERMLLLFSFKATKGSLRLTHSLTGGEKDGHKKGLLIHRFITATLRLRFVYY